MSVLSTAPNTTGKELYFGGTAFRTTDDASDSKSAGVYSHNAKEFSATECNEFKSLFEFLQQLAVVGASYKQTYTCVSGLAVGDPVYLSAASTATLADSTTSAKARVFGFCAYKPTTTTCYVVHFYYKSGLSGLTVNNPVYLTDAGGFSASAGTITRRVGIALTTTTALVFGGAYTAGQDDITVDNLTLELVNGILRLKAAGTTLAKLESRARPNWNYLINGGFDICQRTDPTTTTTIADASYGPDRWKVLRENANIRYDRQDATAESGINCKFYGRFSSTVNNGKHAIYQIIEGRDVQALRGRTVVFQAKLRTNTNQTFRMGVFELGTGGTIDTVPSLFSSMSSSNSTDPTKGSNINALTGTAVTDAQGTINATPGNSVLDCAVLSASWQQFAISVTVPTTALNLVCAIWSDSDIVAANGFLKIAEAGLYDGAELRDWLPRPLEEELALCQRFYEKSYNADVVPATSTNAGRQFVLNVTTGSETLATTVKFAVHKRANPTITLYDLSTNVNKITRYLTGAAATNNITPSGSPNAGESCFDMNHGEAGLQGVGFHWTAEIEL